MRRKRTAWATRGGPASSAPVSDAVTQRPCRCQRERIRPSQGGPGGPSAPGPLPARRGPLGDLPGREDPGAFVWPQPQPCAHDHLCRSHRPLSPQGCPRPGVGRLCWPASAGSFQLKQNGARAWRIELRRGRAGAVPVTVAATAAWWQGRRGWPWGACQEPRLTASFLGRPWAGAEALAQLVLRTPGGRGRAPGSSQSLLQDNYLITPRE